MATGDETALAELYDSTCSLLYGLALHVVRDAGAAEEATLDAYSQAFREAERFDPARGAVMAWLQNLVRSRAIDRLRQFGGVVRRLELPIETAAGRASLDSGPQDAAWSVERRERVAQALHRLSPEQREAIHCVFFLGLSHSEASVHLRAPLGTVKTRIRTGMERLRSSLLELEALP
jgi:RNA polymerase sigma-70 factor (ECF subfamily)